MVYKLGRHALRFLLPTSCLLCRRATRHGLCLCPDCIGDLPEPLITCDICALPLGSPGTCGRCLARHPDYDGIQAALLYQPPVSQLVQRLKYSHRIYVAHLFASLLLPLLTSREDVPDVLVPVPLHSGRMRRRGFNQAWEITRRLSRLCGIPADPKLLTRSRSTPAQTGLSASQRQRNLRDAFRVNGETEKLHIAVIDDVMTTGSTLQAIAGTLKRSGATRVTGLVVARAVKHL